MSQILKKITKWGSVFYQTSRYEPENEQCRIESYFCMLHIRVFFHLILLVILLVHPQSTYKHHDKNQLWTQISLTQIINWISAMAKCCVILDIGILNVWMSVSRPLISARISQFVNDCLALFCVPLVYTNKYLHSVNKTNINSRTRNFQNR